MEERLSDLCSKLDDLLALYKLVHADTIKAAKDQLLANDTRRKIYERCDGTTGVTEISRELGISQPAVSAHVAALLEAGLLSRTSGNGRAYYQKRLEG